MSPWNLILETLSHALLLAQTGEELIESGRMWYRIGAVGVGLGGLIMGLGLIFNKDKPGKPTDPRVAVIAKILGVGMAIGGIGLAIYMFANTP